MARGVGSSQRHRSMLTRIAPILPLLAAVFLLFLSLPLSSVQLSAKRPSNWALARLEALHIVRAGSVRWKSNWMHLRRMRQVRWGEGFA